MKSCHIKIYNGNHAELMTSLLFVETSLQILFVFLGSEKFLQSTCQTRRCPSTTSITSPKVFSSMIVKRSSCCRPGSPHVLVWPLFCAHYFRDNYGPYTHPWGVRAKPCPRPRGGSYWLVYWTHCR